MNKATRILQLLLRLSVGIGFLTPVADRLGLIGAFGKPNIEWGGWQRFIDYTGTLMPYLERPVVNMMGILATIAEAAIGLLLVVGFKTRIAALGSSTLTMVFIIAMSISVGVKAPINYAVFTTCFASVFISTVSEFDWSIDWLLQKKDPGNSTL